MEGKLSDLSAVMDMKAKELTNLDKWDGMGKGDPQLLSVQNECFPLLGI